MLNNEDKLGQKYITQQEIESEIKDAKFRLDITKYEINTIKDAIISEYEKQLEHTRQSREDLEDKLSTEYKEQLEEKDQQIQELKEAQN